MKAKHKQRTDRTKSGPTPKRSKQAPVLPPLNTTPVPGRRIHLDRGGDATALAYAPCGRDSRNPNLVWSSDPAAVTCTFCHTWLDSWEQVPQWARGDEPFPPYQPPPPPGPSLPQCGVLTRRGNRCREVARPCPFHGGAA